MVNCNIFGCFFFYFMDGRSTILDKKLFLFLMLVANKVYGSG